MGKLIHFKYLMLTWCKIVNVMTKLHVKQATFRAHS